MMLSKIRPGVTILSSLMLALVIAIAMVAIGPARALVHDDTPVDPLAAELQIADELPPADFEVIDRLPGSVGATLPDITLSDWTEVPINNVFLMVGGLASLLLLASGLVLIVIGSSTQTEASR